MYTHRKLYAHLANGAGCRALIVNYRRAPEHRYPAQLEDALAAYRWLLRERVDSKQIALAGDSAGGGLAVSTLMYIRDYDLPLPAAALLLSP